MGSEPRYFQHSLPERCLTDNEKLEVLAHLGAAFGVLEDKAIANEDISGQGIYVGEAGIAMAYFKVCCHAGLAFQ